MFGQLLNIAGNTFIEAIRQPVYFVVITAGWLLQILNVALSGYTMGLTDESEVTKDDKMLLDVGLATVLLCATLLAALICTSVVSREIENKTALTVIAKPIGRPVFIIGKYLGATAAVLVAGVILSAFFLLGLRQGSISTVRDGVDVVVATFGLGALALSMGVGAWANFFYGWVFSSTTIFLMAPAIVLAWAGTLLVGEGWTLQPIGTEWKPDVMLTVASVLLMLPVLSGVALAASTRLGQVMTIVVCAGVLLGGLLSNHVFGRRAIDNVPIARVAAVEVLSDDDEDFLDPRDQWKLTLELSPELPVGRGDSVYYGPAPSGLRLAVPPHDRFEGDLGSGNDVLTAPGSVTVERLGGEKLDELTIVNAGGLEVARAPMEGDFLFLRPTVYNPAMLGLWGIVPNIQFFWLVDAVTQGHQIPAGYVGLTAIYALLLVIALNGIAVALFQRREVG